MSSAGRICPTGYRYRAADLCRGRALVADTLYVVGGLYGNAAALDEVLRMAALEQPRPLIVFNGDFHWFDADPTRFARIDAAVAREHAIAGNVEVELCAPDDSAGCGCAYPETVGADMVARSNAIHARLKATAARHADILHRLAALPRHTHAQVGPARVAIVHGDAESLAGWGFERRALDDPAHHPWLREVFAASGADVFASSHTCLPVCRSYQLDARLGVVINNGAAGMPNFAGSHHGLITRIATTRSPHPTCYGLWAGGVRIDALPLRYDPARFAADFLRDWPAGSAAHLSYWARIERGTDYYFGDAVPLLHARANTVAATPD